VARGRLYNSTLEPFELLASHCARARNSLVLFCSNESLMTMAKPALTATQTKSPEEAALRYEKMREASVKRSISVVQPEKEVRSSILTPS